MKTYKVLSYKSNIILICITGLLNLYFITYNRILLDIQAGVKMNEKTVGMLSKFTGVSVHTIKYYEKLGLISSNRREQSNYRSYDVQSCTDIYECIKYRNMGFPLKEIQQLLKNGDNALLSSLLEKRSQELAAEATELLNTRELIENYRKELADLDRKLGNWYIEDCPNVYFRRQTKGLNYMDEASCESDGINLAEYAPRSSSLLELSPEYFKGDISAFSWGQGITVDSDNDFMKDKKGFERISGGRMFTAYMSLGGHYASQGDLINDFLRYYNEYKSGVPKNPVYGFRLRITLDETGDRKDYFRMQLPLK